MRLYRYMPMAAVLSTIRHGMWRLGRIEDFNDPFDCRFAFAHRRLSVAEDFFSPFSKRFRDEQFSKYGILCFSRNRKIPAMWAHYADNMKGACFECEQPEDEALFKVHYSDERLIFDVTDDTYLASQECRDHVIEIIKRKHSCWEYEEEQRIFIKLGGNDVLLRSPRRTAYGAKPYHWLPIAPGSIKRVIVGPMASEGDLALLKDMIKAQKAFEGASICRAVVHPTKFLIDL